MREKIAMKSSLIGVCSQMLTLVLGFISTRVFLEYLGVELRGINGLISNCLSMLQLAELGIGTAVTYALYQPLVEKNIIQIKALMDLYKKIYRYLGSAIFIIGVIFSCFLGFFIQGSSYSDNYIQFIFYLQLFSTTGSYFFAYRRNLLYADQKQYIITSIDLICNTVSSICKIFVVIYWQSYVGFLVIQIIQTFAANLLIYKWYEREYEFLATVKNVKYEKIAELIKNVKNIFIGHVGSFIYCSTDNLIISKFVGISAVGYMANYYQISVVLRSFSISITAPIQPMIGNFIREIRDEKKRIEFFFSYTFIRYCIALIMVSGLCVMLNPLIELWLGQSYVLSRWIPILLSVDLFFTVFPGATCDYITVLGLFKNDRDMSLIGMFINLFLSLILVNYYNVEGVLMGTICSQLYYFVARTYIVFYKYFKYGLLKYIKRVIQYCIVAIINVTVLYYISYNVLSNGISILNFILMCVCCIVISLISIIMFFFYTYEFKFLIGFLKRQLIDKLNR